MPAPTPTAKYGVRIITSDPTTGVIEGAAKGGQLIRISVVTTPVAFRWPVAGEAWMVRQENGTWYLDSPWPVSDLSALSPQGNWVGIYGASGYALASFTGAAGGPGTDAIVMPGVTVTLIQGSRFVWAAGTSDVRALENADRSVRNAGTYDHATQVQVQLTFAAAYKGTLGLYAVDWDAQGRRETIAVGTQVAHLSGDFSDGTWINFPINQGADSTLTITATSTTGLANAVLSGIFLGYGPPTTTIQTVNPGDAVLNAPTGKVHVLGSADGSTDFTLSKDGGVVSSFNARTGAVTLSKADVTGTGLTAADLGITNGTIFFPPMRGFATQNVSGNVLSLVQVAIPGGVTITGITADAFDAPGGNMRVALYTSSGTLIASSASRAWTASIQRVPFSSSYLSAGGNYFLGLQSSIGFGVNVAVVESLSGAIGQGSFTIPASITPPTAPSDTLVPVLSTY